MNNADKLVSTMTKRELFCLEAGIPDTGDPELNKIIKKGNRKKAASAAMQGLLSSASDSDGQWCHGDAANVANEAVIMADFVLARLANTQGE